MHCQRYHATRLFPSLGLHLTRNFRLRIVTVSLHVSHFYSREYTHKHHFTRSNTILIAILWRLLNLYKIYCSTVLQVMTTHSSKCSLIMCECFNAIYIHYTSEHYIYTISNGQYLQLLQSNILIRSTFKEAHPHFNVIPHFLAQCGSEPRTTTITASAPTHAPL